MRSLGSSSHSVTSVSLLLFSLALVLFGCGWLGLGVSHLPGDQSGPATQSKVIPLAPIALGDPIDRNVLKGIAVAGDPEEAKAYVSGILTGSIAVVSLKDGGTLERSFRFTDDAWSVKRPVFDPVHRKLWIATAEGTDIWVVDPDAEVLDAHLDMSGDLPSSQRYPVWDVALDPDRQRLYLAASDVILRYGYANGTLSKEATITRGDLGLSGQAFRDLSWDANRDRLVVLTVPKRNSGAPGRIVTLEHGNVNSTQQINSPGGSLLIVDHAGNFIVAGSETRGGSSILTRVRDSSGSQVWQVRLDQPSAALAACPPSGVFKPRVAVLYQSGSEPDRHISRLAVYRYDIPDGTAGGTRAELFQTKKARYRATHLISVDAIPCSFVVGNDGDGSISYTEMVSAVPFMNHVQVGFQAGRILLTDDGKALVLSRLGGSELIEVDLSTGAGQVVELGDWPVGFALGPPVGPPNPPVNSPSNSSAEGLTSPPASIARKLFVLNHFTSEIKVLNASTLVALGTINLGVDGSLTDTIGYLEADPDGHLLAALIGEQGKVVFVDGESQSVLTTRDLGIGFATDQGPGRMLGAVDGSGDGRVFVYVREENKLYRFDGPHFGSDSVEIHPDPVALRSYSDAALYYSAALGKLFVYNLVVDPDSLAVVGEVEAHRVVAEESGTLYGQTAHGGDEQLLAIDANTYETRWTASLANTGGTIKSGVAFDFAGRMMVMTDPVKARLLLFELD